MATGALNPWMEAEGKSCQWVPALVSRKCGSKGPVEEATRWRWHHTFAGATEEAVRAPGTEVTDGVKGNRASQVLRCTVKKAFLSL